MKLPLTTPDCEASQDLASQREYVACRQAGIGFAAHGHDRGSLWLYRLERDHYAALLVPRGGEPRTLFTAIGREQGLDWITWVRQRALAVLKEEEGR